MNIKESAGDHNFREPLHSELRRSLTQASDFECIEYSGAYALITVWKHVLNTQINITRIESQTDRMPCYGALVSDLHPFLMRMTIMGNTIYQDVASSSGPSPGNITMYIVWTPVSSTTPSYLMRVCLLDVKNQIKVEKIISSPYLEYHSSIQMKESFEKMIQEMHHVPDIDYNTLYAFDPRYMLSWMQHPSI